MKSRSNVYDALFKEREKMLKGRADTFGRYDGPGLGCVEDLLNLSLRNL